MKIDELDYRLPPELIAQTPAEPRDSSRLLVIDRSKEGVEHRVFSELTDYLRPGDLMVFNDTRVIPARFHALKETGARLEFLLLKNLGDGRWTTLIRGRRKLRKGHVLTVEGAQDVRLAVELGSGERGDDVAVFDESLDVIDMLNGIGEVPLPPYIRDFQGDTERYQTVLARHEGSVAAPTAALHFTPELLERIDAMGVERRTVTLDVGWGTFAPLEKDVLEENSLHSERVSVPPDTARAVLSAKAAKRRVIAVGTTAVRTLEGVYRQNLLKESWSGEVNIFITPGYEFNAVDAMLTNFHLPRTSLLSLVFAMASRDRILAAYEEAVLERYRFYSFGDAMLIV